MPQSHQPIVFETRESEVERDGSNVLQVPPGKKSQGRKPESPNCTMWSAIASERGESIPSDGKSEGRQI